MIVVVAAVPLLVAVWMARAPVSDARVERFRSRYALELTPEQRRQVVTYLGHTRRWRIAGMCLGYVAALPEQRVAVPVVAVAGGWLAGAVVAEARCPLPGGAAPSLLRRVPAILAACAAGGTAVMLIAGSGSAPLGALGPGMTVPVLAVGALACADGVHLANRFVARRPADAELGPAFAVHSAGAVAGVGVTLTVACLVSQAEVVRDSYFDTTNFAIGVAGMLWAIGGVLIGAFVATAGRGSAAGLRSRVGGTVVALCVATAGILGYAWQHDRPPFPASALEASATVRLTGTGHFAADARAVGAPGLEVLHHEGAQPFVGRLDYRLPADADHDGSFHVVVIDKRRDVVAPQMVGADGGGWDGILNGLPRRYPWLSALEPDRTDGGFTDAGMSVTVPAGTPGPVAFVGGFPDAAGMITPADLMVVLIHTGPDGQTYWAHRVTVAYP